VSLDGRTLALFIRPSRATGRSISIAIAQAALAPGISTVRAVAARVRGTREPRPGRQYRRLGIQPVAHAVAHARRRPRLCIQPPHGQLSDLYTTGRVRGKFAPAWNLGPLVNTTADEYHPMLRADQNRLYFVRQEVNPPGDSQFYVADARCLLQLR